MDIKDLTRDALQSGNPALFASLQSEFSATGHAAGAAAEIQRRADVLACSVPGHEKLVAELANDGKTTAAEAALKVNAAVRQAHTVAADAHAKDAPPPAKGSAAADDKPVDRQGQWAQVQAYLKEHNSSDVQAAYKALGFDQA